MLKNVANSCTDMVDFCRPDLVMGDILIMYQYIHTWQNFLISKISNYLFNLIFQLVLKGTIGYSNYSFAMVTFKCFI